MSHGNIASTIQKSKNRKFIWTERLKEKKIEGKEDWKKRR